MGICWYCYWGWAKPVAEIYKQASEKLGGDEMPLDHGPGHIVWGEENWDSVEGCLERFEDNKLDYSEEELAVVRWSLEELAKIPLEQREIVPKDYDGNNPENFPPAKGVEVVKML